MKNFLPGKFEFKGKTIWQIVGLVILALIVLTVLFRLLGSILRPNYPHPEFSQADGWSEDRFLDEPHSRGRGVKFSNGSQETTLTESLSASNSAEEYEVEDYQVWYQTHNLDNSCQRVLAWKSDPDIIFTSSNTDQTSCRYSFKVAKEKTTEVLNLLESWKPKNLVANTVTILNQVEGYQSEIEILTNKLAVMEKTLAEALVSYEEISKLATRQKDTSSLANIISSKVAMVEKLTQEKININSQLARLERLKSKQLERLQYSFFQVSVAEDKYFDWLAIKDSWQREIKQVVRDINQVFQDLTVKLVVVLLRLVQLAVYLILLLVIVKYGYRIGKSFWLK